MSDDRFRLLIERRDVEGVRHALETDPGLANRTVRWFLNQENETDPLHYVSDCVANGWLTNGQEGPMATLLLASGAAIVFGTVQGYGPRMPREKRDQVGAARILRNSPGATRDATCTTCCATARMPLMAGSRWWAWQ
jgi:hypothetical protein